MKLKLTAENENLNHLLYWKLKQTKAKKGALPWQFNRVIRRITRQPTCKTRTLLELNLVEECGNFAKDAL